MQGVANAFLVLGSKATDASVATITSSYLNLELLDVSGWESVIDIFLGSCIFVGLLCKGKLRDGLLNTTKK